MIHDFEYTPMHMRPIPNPTPLSPKKDKETNKHITKDGIQPSKNYLKRSKNRKILSAFYLHFLKVKEQSKRHLLSNISLLWQFTLSSKILKIAENWQMFSHSYRWITNHIKITDQSYFSRISNTFWKSQFNIGTVFLHFNY